MAAGSYFVLLRSINENEQYEDEYKVEDFKIKYTEKIIFQNQEIFILMSFISIL